MEFKKNCVIICAFILLQSTAAHSNTKMLVTPEINLEIVGITEENVLPEGIQVTLFKQDDQLNWINQGSINYNNSLSMSLIRNSNYVIKISKKGYASRTYCFSTLFNSKETISEIKFSFDLNFFKFNNEIKNTPKDLSFTMTSNCPTSSIGVNKL